MAACISNLQGTYAAYTSGCSSNIHKESTAKEIVTAAHNR
jgi:hypothetical protein